MERLFAGRDLMGNAWYTVRRSKMLVHGDNGWLERIPSYIRRVVQDEHTKDYTGAIMGSPPSRSTGAAIRSISPP